MFHKCTVLAVRVIHSLLFRQKSFLHTPPWAQYVLNYLLPWHLFYATSSRIKTLDHTRNDTNIHRRYRLTHAPAQIGEYKSNNWPRYRIPRSNISPPFASRLRYLISCKLDVEVIWWPRSAGKLFSEELRHVSTFTPMLITVINSQSNTPSKGPDKL